MTDLSTRTQSGHTQSNQTQASGAQSPAGTAPKLAVHLRGERVQLVPQDKEMHLENYVQWLNDGDVTRWMLMNTPLSRADEAAWFDRLPARTDSIVWAVHDETGKHIGTTGLHALDWKGRSGISGICIGDKSAWGKGYGSEVMQVRTRYAFEELGLWRIESECFVANKGSAGCLENAGYRQIGIARKKRWRAGQWRDCILWEILAEDYYAAQETSQGSSFQEAGR